MDVSSWKHVRRRVRIAVLKVRFGVHLCYYFGDQIIDGEREALENVNRQANEIQLDSSTPIL